jgi:rhodanese-related sulfurtransferase
VRALLGEGAQLVDVLLREEHEDEHLPGAISIPLKELNRQTTSGGKLVGHMYREDVEHLAGAKT